MRIITLIAAFTCAIISTAPASAKGPKWTTEYGNQVFRVIGPKGENTVMTHDDGAAICQSENGELADPWLMRSMSLTSGTYCSGCGWVERAGRLHAMRSVCGKQEQEDIETGKSHRMFVNCAADPDDEPDHKGGYNVFCRSTAKSWTAKVRHYYRTHDKSGILFQVEGPDGPKSIKTYEEAEIICQTMHAEVAQFWRLKDAIKNQHHEKCGGCGWMMRTDHKTKAGNLLYYYKNRRSVCGNEEEQAAIKNDDHWIIECADSPAEEGLEGYDAYCYGETGPGQSAGPDVPGDAAPVNYKSPDGELVQGYVFAIEHGRREAIPYRSLAATLCETRLASLATAQQVRQAWYNGLSECTCGWMQNWCGISVNDDVASCGETGNTGCPYGTLTYAYCFVDANSAPLGPNLVDFTDLPEWAYPAGIQPGAVQVPGGYVFMSKASTGDRRARDLFTAKETCARQGGQVAHPLKLENAKKKGYTSCECAWAWDDVIVASNTDAIVDGGAVLKVCPKNNGDATVEDCPIDNPEGDGAGYNIHCYIQCPYRCPPAKNWNIPYRGVRINLDGLSGMVFHVQGECDKYCLNRQEAAEKCAEHKGQLATKAQLKAAQSHGLSKCRCGYIADGTKWFPIARIRISGCANELGVFECPGYPDIPVPGEGQNPNKWDAYCFVSEDQLDVPSRFSEQDELDTMEDFVSDEVFAEVESPHRGNKPTEGYTKMKTDKVKDAQIAARKAKEAAAKAERKRKREEEAAARKRKRLAAEAARKAKKAGR